MPRFVVVGNASCRRVELFQAALARLSQPLAQVVLWTDLLANRTTLSEHLRPGDIVRFESTGRDFQVQQQLLSRGTQEAANEGFRVLSGEFVEERGKILPSRQWFLGLRSLFAELRAELSDWRDLRFMHDLSDCLTMSDKIACHQRLLEAGVSIPASLGEIGSFEALEEKMQQKGWSRVFGKLAYGSSASGVFALQTHRGQWRVQTTVEMVEQGGETHLYNSRRPQIYHSKHEIARLVNALSRDRLLIERWLPKATQGGQSFDCRFVVLRGQIRQSVMRLSNGPMTNLHLGNDRASVDPLRQSMGEARWQKVEETLRQAMTLFSASLFAGADVAFSPSLQHHAILELNAWGDLLPGVLHQGRDTYEDQIQTILAESGESCS